jgi:hypothetical protein
MYTLSERQINVTKCYTGPRSWCGESVAYVSVLLAAQESVRRQVIW